MSSVISEVGAIGVESTVVIAKFETQVDRVAGPSAICLLGVTRKLCDIDPKILCVSGEVSDVLYDVCVMSFFLQR